MLLFMVLYVMFVYTVEAVNFLTKPLKFIGSNCKYANCFSLRVKLCDHNLKNLGRYMERHHL